jgi:ADP-ribose diphosphatase
MTHITHIVLARDLYPEKLEGDEPEELEVVPWPISDLTSLTAREDCTEGRTIAALYIARDYLWKESNDA